MVQRLQLLQSEHQILEAISEFACVGDRTKVAYEDFYQTLEASANNVRNTRLVQIGRPSSGEFGQSNNIHRVVDGNGYDGLRDSATRPQSATRQSIDRGRYASGGRREDLDAGTDNAYLAPPKVSDSISVDRTGSANRRSSDVSNWRRDSDSTTDSGGEPGANWERFNGYSDPRRSAQAPASTPLSRSSYNAMNYNDPYRRSGNNYYNTTYRSTNSTLNQSLNQSLNSSLQRPISPARVSPARVGSMMWGKKVPKSQRGVPPSFDKQTWCCAVCMWTENEVGAPNCGICDAPNYSERKVNVLLLHVSVIHVYKAFFSMFMFACCTGICAERTVSVLRIP